MSRSILVVDDEPDIRLLARMTLETQGHDVAEAGDGEEALEMIERETPDLVLLDIRMPELDGWGVLERLRADARLERLSVVMMSAHSDPATLQRALDGGCSGYLTKPFSNKELLRAVERYAGSRA